MADGGLSQEEIDALLADTDFEDFEAAETPDVGLLPGDEETEKIETKPLPKVDTSTVLDFADIDSILDSQNLQLLLDITMELTVEIGRSKMLVKDILNLKRGSVIELEKMIGDPVDVLVNNRLVARGEVVVIDEYFGVRVTEIIDPMERYKALNTSMY